VLLVTILTYVSSAVSTIAISYDTKISTFSVSTISHNELQNVWVEINVVRTQNVSDEFDAFLHVVVFIIL